MDSRLLFNTIPEQFDKWRPRYCEELFNDLIEYAVLDSGKSVLEVGPGTGQATEPVLKTGCSYLAIELGDNLMRFMESKFSPYRNFSIMNADFDIYLFSGSRFYLVYSAAAFQWIPEKIGYPKAYDILKSGGAFAIFMTQAYTQPGGGYTDEPLYSRIQRVYGEYFRPQSEYICKLDYQAREKYGFVDLECREYHKTREYDADEYISLIGTHSDHISLEEPYKSKFYSGIKAAVRDSGNKNTLYDKIVMYLARKP